MKQKPMSNDYIYLTILAVFVFLALGTFVHDPILHGIVAYAFHWQISDYQNGLMVGSTSAIASVKAPVFQYWLFFMLPALFIFVAVIAATIIRTDRLVFVAGIILMMLNLPSLNPEINGSDAYNAVQLLISRGWSTTGAYAAHYLLFFVIVSLFALYLYIAVENSSKDARKRLVNIVR